MARRPGTGRSEVLSAVFAEARRFLETVEPMLATRDAFRCSILEMLADPANARDTAERTRRLMERADSLSAGSTTPSPLLRRNFTREEREAIEDALKQRLTRLEELRSVPRGTHLLAALLAMGNEADPLALMARAARRIYVETAAELERLSEPEWFACSKAEWLRALDKSERYIAFLEKLRKEGVVEIRTANPRVGNRTIEFLYRDPAEHERVCTAINDERRTL